MIPKYSNFKFSDFDQKITFLVLFQGPLYEQEVYGGMNSRLFMNIHDSHVSQAELTWPLRRVLCRVQAKQNSRPKISNINPTQIVQKWVFSMKNEMWNFIGLNLLVDSVKFFRGIFMETIFGQKTVKMKIRG